MFDFYFRYAYEYNAIPGFLQREKSIVGDVKVRLQPHDKSIEHV
jgi:hypothetical protein